MAEFAKAYPKVRLAMDFNNQKQDLIRDSIDLAIRIGPLQDSGLKSKKLFDIERCLVIAPATMGRQPPLVPDDLREWPWIGLRMRPNHRTLTNAGGEVRQIDFEPRVVVNSIDVVCQLAIAGIAYFFSRRVRRLATQRSARKPDLPPYPISCGIGVCA